MAGRGYPPVSTSSRTGTGRLFGKHAEARRHRHRHPAGPQRRLYQARDRPSRRHDRSASTDGSSSTASRSRRRSRPPAHDPGRCQRPLLAGVSGVRRRGAATARNIAGCRSSARRCPTASPTTRWTSTRSAQGDNYGPIAGAARPCIPDGRQPRPQRRQPLPAAEHGLGGPVPWENIGGRAEFITFSLDGTTRMVEPVDLVRSVPRRAAPEPRCAAHKD